MADLAHIDGRCPARHCKALITYTISDRCFGCTRCAQHCPADAIEARLRRAAGSTYSSLGSNFTRPGGSMTDGTTT